MALFAELGLDEKIVKALDEMGYTTPTEIQEKTLEAFGTGKHIVGQSQTGSGKTAAFLLPLLNSIDAKIREPQALILAPTRELASQIRDEVFELSKHLFIRSVSVFGGSSKRKQIDILEKGPQIVIGTPGRVQDLIDMRKLKLKNIQYFVLDEVDRMLDMGFVDDIKAIWQRMDTVKQVMTFSATIPTELKSIISQYIGGEDDYVSIKVAGKVIVDTVDHMFMEVPTFRKYEVLKGLLTSNPGIKCVVFSETKRGTDQLAEALMRDGFSASGLHGDMEQRDRFRTLKGIKENEVNILVATDVAARGLNMKDIGLVINYEVPHDSESYIHRIGRTARAGQSGAAIMFCDPGEYPYLHAIEKRNALTVRRVTETGEDMERTDRRRGAGTFDRSQRFQPRSGGRGGRSYGSRGPSRGGQGGSSYSGGSRGGSSYGGARSAESRDGGERRTSSFGERRADAGRSDARPTGPRSADSRRPAAGGYASRGSTSRRDPEKHDKGDPRRGNFGGRR